MSNYATKVDLKNVTSNDTSKCAKNIDSASWNYNVAKLDINKSKDVTNDLKNLKGKADKLNIDKFVPVTVDLIDVVKNYIVGKMYIMLR